MPHPRASPAGRHFPNPPPRRHRPVAFPPLLPTVARLFRDFVAGRSPRQIAHTLDADGLPGPGRRPWIDTTIRGQAARGTGILNKWCKSGWVRVSSSRITRCSGQRHKRPFQNLSCSARRAMREQAMQVNALWMSIRRKRSFVALLPLGRTDVLGRPGYGLFELSLWMTLSTTRRVSSDGLSC